MVHRAAQVRQRSLKVVAGNREDPRQILCWNAPRSGSIRPFEPSRGPQSAHPALSFGSRVFGE